MTYPQSHPLPANHPLYHQTFKLPKWSKLVSVANARCPRTAGQLLRRQLPQWTKEQHLAAAQYHRARAAKLQRVWDAVWTRSFTQAFNRPPEFSDYHITAIGREEISEAKKRVLRHCAYTRTNHKDLALAHERAAGLRKHPAS